MFGPSVREALAGLGGDLQVAIPLDRVQQVCAAGDSQGRCAGATGRTCRGWQGPLLPQPAGPVAFDARRRALLARGALAGVALAVTRVVGGAIATAERLLGSDADTGTGCWPALPRGRVRPLAWRRARRRTGQHSPSPASPSTSAATRRRVRKLG
jgi:hypothetical protein